MWGCLKRKEKDSRGETSRETDARRKIIEAAILDDWHMVSCACRAYYGENRMSDIDSWWVFSRQNWLPRVQRNMRQRCEEENVGFYWSPAEIREVLVQIVKRYKGWYSEDVVNSLIDRRGIGYRLHFVRTSYDPVSIRDLPRVL
jgi:hypothetical protein